MKYSPQGRNQTEVAVKYSPQGRNLDRGRCEIPVTRETHKVLGKLQFSSSRVYL